MTEPTGCLGEWHRRNSGEYELFTERGWITVDTYAELQEEIKSLQKFKEGERATK